MSLHMLSFAYGDYVVDQDASMPELAVVVNHPPKTASEWEVEPERTVADDNPEYPRGAPVVIVAYEEHLTDYDPDWDEYEGQNRSLSELAQNNVPYYAFPRPRLSPAPQELISQSIEPTPAAQWIKDKLDDSMQVYFKNTKTVVARKFGNEYTISPGDVGGSGVLKDRLEEIAAEAEKME